MGMDWHSSGITTSVMGALKRGLNPRAENSGCIFAAAAESNRARRQTNADGSRAARPGWRSTGPHEPLTAKIDNNCIADGFQIYLHTLWWRRMANGRSSSKG